MKTSRYRNLLVLLCTLGCTAFAWGAKDFEKVISEEFAIAADGEVELYNKYGSIDVTTWNEPRVRVDVTIIIEARNEDRAQEVFDRININFTNSTSFVGARTEIEESRGWNKFWNSGSSFEIHYKVKLPETVRLDLEMKYGDVYIGEKQGDTDVIIKYGNLRMDGISGDLDLDMGYGKGSVTTAGNVNLIVKYSSLRFGDVGDVRAESKYSGFEFGEIGDLRCSTSYDNYRMEKVGSFFNIGKYDDFAIKEAESVSMDSKYSHLGVQKLHESADLTFKYGGVEIEDIQAGFNSIEIESEYTGVKLGVNPGARFNMEAYGKYCPVRHSDLEVYYQVEDGSESVVKGFRGSRDADASIIARMKYGSFRIF